MSRPLRRLLAVALGVVLVAVAAVAIHQLTGHQDSPTERAAATRARQARQVAKKAGLPTAVQDLLARAAGAVGQRFTVTYRTGPDTTATLIQRPPSKRVDETVGQGDAAVTRSLIVNDTGSFSCLRQAGRWTCRRATTAPADIGAFTPDEIKATVDRLVSQRAQFRFAVTRRRLAGADATCLVTTERHPTAQPATGRLCISPEGAPLLVDGAGGHIEAIAYAARASARALQLPTPAR